ncbi:hypothetical protein HPB51_025746 [Rhipicephalus microplus]|uniref:Transposase Tc1-like domain-containing protein n=1 Tax=Rhipicephalus microplus TaxID=6941 RepID=A0A9J6F9V6_RHIMP|nr:hypothetical protein HPB51_025746 [Rhipicephalus microplus]
MVPNFRKDGTRVNVKRSGRPRVTVHEAYIFIVAAAVVDPFLSAKEFQDELSLNVSTKTVSRQLNEIGIYHFAAAQKPFLFERQRQQRLDFASNHQHCKEEEWKNLLFF